MESLEKILESLQKDVKESNKKRDLYMYKNDYIANIIKILLYEKKILNQILYVNIFVCLVFTLVVSVNKSIAFYITYMLLMFLLYVEIYYISKIQMAKKYDDQYKELLDRTFNKITKLWLLNGKVVSLKNWNKIKKTSKTEYKYLTTKESSGHCYYSTFSIAHNVKEKDVKILWILCEFTRETIKFGHAVLEKNGYIYDPNQKRTYPYDKYMEAYHAEKAIEIKYDKYIVSNTYKEFLDDTSTEWKKFEIFCRERGGYPTVEDFEKSKE